MVSLLATNVRATPTLNWEEAKTGIARQSYAGSSLNPGNLPVRSSNEIISPQTGAGTGAPPLQSSSGAGTGAPPLQSSSGADTEALPLLPILAIKVIANPHLV
ncbi:MAG: hypothetical protein HC941_15190 [Microcoleus sp. SU_5_3]|nr:hypothetical protein [Microcoleus sp. SU_5_3]